MAECDGTAHNILDGSLLATGGETQIVGFNIIDAHPGKVAFEDRTLTLPFTRAACESDDCDNSAGSGFYVNEREYAWHSFNFLF